MWIALVQIWIHLVFLTFFLIFKLNSLNKWEQRHGELLGSQKEFRQSVLFMFIIILHMKWKSRFELHVLCPRNTVWIKISDDKHVAVLLCQCLPSLLQQ